MGKEKVIRLAACGQKACQNYRALSEALIEAPGAADGVDDQRLAKTAARLKALTTRYDAAARRALTMAQ